MFWPNMTLYIQKASLAEPLVKKPFFFSQKLTMVDERASLAEEPLVKNPFFFLSKTNYDR